MQATDSAVAHQLGGDAELRGRTLLRPDLKDNALLLDDIAQDSAFGHREGGRLLQVDMFPPGPPRWPAVHASGPSADDDGIDLPIEEHLLIQAVHLDIEIVALPRSSSDRSSLPVVCRPPDGLRPDRKRRSAWATSCQHGSGQIVIAGDAAASDLADLYLVAGSVFPQDRRGHDHGRHGSADGNW